MPAPTKMTKGPNSDKRMSELPLRVLISSTQSGYWGAYLLLWVRRGPLTKNQVANCIQAIHPKAKNNRSGIEAEYRKLDKILYLSP